MNSVQPKSVVIDTVAEYVRQIGKWIIEIDIVYNSLNGKALDDWHTLNSPHHADYIRTINHFPASCRDGKPLITGIDEKQCENNVERMQHEIIWRGKAFGEGAESLTRRINMIELTTKKIEEEVEKMIKI